MIGFLFVLAVVGASLIMLRIIKDLIMSAYREGRIEGLTLARRLIINSDNPLKDIDDITSEDIQKHV